MKLDEQKRLQLQNIFLKAQVFIVQSPLYEDIVALKKQENELLRKTLEEQKVDKEKVIRIDYESGEITLKEE